VAITSARNATSNAISSTTDSLGRQTTYTYDAFGNLSSLTRLAGTANAVPTSFTYEPAFNQLASVTDPLNHTTMFAYDSRGALSAITDAMGNSTTFTTNEAGQPLTIATRAGITTFGYLGTDLISVSDPLGNVTRHFVDAVGRVAGATMPLVIRWGLTTGTLVSTFLSYPASELALISSSTTTVLISYQGYMSELAAPL
jgi:YD repeat-containing protein